MPAIQHLSRIEKLRMMEAIWRDLSADAEAMDSPAWHDKALHQAEAALAEGSARWLDWAEAKNLLSQRRRA